MKMHLPCSQKLQSKVELNTTFVLESDEHVDKIADT